MNFKSFILLALLILGVICRAAAAPAREIVIGYTGPLSGPAAEYGQDCLNGIEMAIHDINIGGGITVKGKNYTFRLEKMDDQVKPQIAVNNALQMRKEYKVVAVFNPVFSTLAGLMKINQDPKNEFLVMAYTSVPQASEMGNKLAINMVLPFTTYNKVVAQIAWDRGWRKGAIVVTAGAYGDAWRKVFRGEWEKKGGVITVDRAANYYTRTDFVGPLAEALDTDPDFLLIGGPSATTALIIEQARRKGFEGGFVLIDQAKLDAIHAVMEKPLGLEGAIGIAMASSIPFDPPEATEKFKKDYIAAYKRQYTWESSVHYTCMHLLSQAIVAAGTTTDVKAIRAAVPKVFPLLGGKYPAEFFGITPSGRLISAAVVQYMKHGRFAQPASYIWWTNTKKEFDHIQKISQGTIPLTRFKMN